MTDDQQLRLEVLRIAASFGDVDDIAAIAERMWAFVVPIARPVAALAVAPGRKIRARATREEIEHAIRLIEGGTSIAKAARTIGYTASVGLRLAAKRFGLTLPVKASDAQLARTAKMRAALAAKQAAAA